MGAKIVPNQVEIESLKTVSAEQIQAAAREGKKIKYICRAKKEADGQIKASVKPERISETDPVINVDGTSAAVTLYTDLAGELTVVQSNPGILQTAYGVLSDLLVIVHSAERYEQ